MRAYTDREEADLVASSIHDRIRETGDSWSEVAVLYRTNSQSKSIEDSLRHRGIPYRIYKGSSFYDHKEIKDLLAYLRLVINPRDDEAFRRIVNYPARGIGNTTVDRIAALAAERGVSMWEAVDALVAEPTADAVQKTIVRKVTEFVALIRALSLLRVETGLYEFGLEVAQRSGILPLYRLENSPEAASAIDNIEELLNSMQEFRKQRDAEIAAGERSEEDQATVEEWMQSVMLMTDQDKDDPEDRNRVTLMTVHSSKGLEYKYVFIVGMEENLFPSQRAAESPDGIEEERRPVLRGADPREGGRHALLCRVSFQMGQHGVFASELFPARDRPAGDAAAACGDYAVGQRVEHQKFGVGIIRRIEMLAEDQKLVIAFDNAGEKTLLAKFAKLTKL